MDLEIVEDTYKNTDLYDYLYVREMYPSAWKDFFLRNDVKNEIKKIAVNL